MRQYLAWTILIALFAVGCNPQPLPVVPTPIPTLPPATVPPEPTAVPQVTSATTGEPAKPDASIFDANCAVCHNLTTETKVGPGLAGLFDLATLPNDQPVNDENLREWIKNGGGAMPGIPLTDEQLDVLIAFLKDATQ